MSNQHFFQTAVSPDDFKPDTEEFVYWCKFNFLTPESREYAMDFLTAKLLNVSRQWPSFKLHNVALDISEDDLDYELKIENYEKWKADLMSRINDADPNLQLNISVLI